MQDLLRMAQRLFWQWYLQEGSLPGCSLCSPLRSIYRGEKGNDKREKTDCRSCACVWNSDYVGSHLCIYKSITGLFFAGRGIIYPCSAGIPGFADRLSSSFKAEKSKAGVILISLNGQKILNLNPLGDGLAFLAMISWGAYSALVKKIGEWDYPTVAVTRRIYFYGIIFLIPILIQQNASWDLRLLKNPQVAGNFLFLGLGASATGFLLWNLATKWIGAVKTSVYIYVSPVVTVVLSVFVLHEKMTVVSVLGSVLIFVGLVVSQKKARGDTL